MLGFQTAPRFFVPPGHSPAGPHNTVTRRWHRRFSSVRRDECRVFRTGS
jgi:hypothetical protein